jgi:Zn-dependent peptidase ImmA (M78 family)
MNDLSRSARHLLNVRGGEINDSRRELIRAKADELIRKLWQLEKSRRGPNLRFRQLLPLQPKQIVTELLSLQYDEPEEIGDLRIGTLRVKLAGLLDRDKSLIAVSARLNPDIKRFTAAHEIGHFVLHREITSLREDPRTDAALRAPLRSVREREADLFAAHVLMPPRFFNQVFSNLWGDDDIDCDHLNDDDAYYLTQGKLSARDISKLSRLERAKLVAREIPMTTADALPMTKIFGLSPTATGIHLLDLGRVR